MNRHHPYGGGSFEMRNRGGPPSGPGPDRPQRYAHNNNNNRGRGFGRGRGGGYGGFDNNMSNGAYDQGPPDPSMAPYNNYEGPPQEQYYQNNGYGAGPGPQFPGNPPSAGYEQNYANGNGNGNYEGALET